jgi:hypothetical protein
LFCASLVEVVFYTDKDDFSATFFSSTMGDFLESSILVDLTTSAFLDLILAFSFFSSAAGWVFAGALNLRREEAYDSLGSAEGAFKRLLLLSIGDFKSLAEISASSALLSILLFSNPDFLFELLFFLGEAAFSSTLTLDADV